MGLLAVSGWVTSGGNDACNDTPLRLLAGEHSRARAAALRVREASDVALLLARGQDCQAAAEQEPLLAASAGVEPVVQDERPAPTPEPVGVGDEYRCFSSYWCVGDSTGSYCGFGASGISVHLGMVACRASEMGRQFTVEGYDAVWTCEDTGGPRVENDGCLDFWANDLADSLEHLPQQRPGGIIRWLR
jgi:hypothetical protein